MDPEGVRTFRDDDELDEQRLTAGPASTSSVGQILRRARLARGLDLAEVERETYIRQWQLRAMEEENFGALASAVHAKGLLRVYARFLGLDPERIVQLLDVERYWVQPTGVVPSSRFERPPSLAIPKAIVLTVLTVLVAGLGYYLARQYAEFVAAYGFPSSIANAIDLTPSASPTEAPTPPPTAQPSPTRGVEIASVVGSPTAVVPTPTPVRVPSPSPVPSPVATPTVTPVRIEAEITGRSWLQVEVDGEVVFSGILQAGDRRVWNGEREVSVWTGNAGDVKITHNGRQLGALGTPGQVKIVRWTAS